MSEKDVTGLGLAFGTSEEGLSWAGRALPERSAEFEVNRGMIVDFCGLVEDANPRFWDGDEAPWGLLMTWSFPPPWHPTTPRRPSLGALEVPLPGHHIINVATDTEFLRPLRVGDRVSWTEEIVSVSDLKTTRLGAGHFLTSRTTYFGSQEKAAVNTNIVFRYDIPDDAPEPSNGTNGQSSGGTNGQASGTNGQPVAEPSTGPSAELPTISLPIDYRRVVHNAASTWDWFPGHHNPEYARQQGQRTIYLSTLFFHGFIDRAASEWFGPEYRPQRRRIEMKRSIYAGQTASVVAREIDTTNGVTRVNGTVDSEEGPAVSFFVDMTPTKPRARAE
jgi:acyl dehydratase